VRLRQPAVHKRDGGTPRRERMPVVADGPYDRTLFEVLRAWRREEAQERGLPPYLIFSDRTLRELARLRPSSRYELRAVYGIGDAKLEAFGDAVLKVLAES
jgi:ATP-dependent DNA helicase RecQ